MVPSHPPFFEMDQLNTELDIDPDLEAKASGKPPHLPGHPRVPLHDGTKILNFLAKEFYCSDLESISERLWWMTTQNSGNISPLHKQIVKRRNIIVTDSPKLHLVWINDRIFIKPLPRYIVSYAFWRDYFAEAPPSSSHDDFVRTRRAALGYLRTYYHLIQSEADFRIAQDPKLCLIPQGISWEQFCDFATPLGDITDRQVSGRYCYGEIRLTRLNLYAPILLRKSQFHRVEHQYGAYFARIYVHVLFVIAVVSILLNGLQIVVGIEQVRPLPDSETLLGVALWVSVVIMVVFVAILLGLVLLLIYKIAKEWKFAISDRMRIVAERRKLLPQDTN
ncbi:hypothetical protein VHEMI01290 [[Torrubiella] hemipterigena]|uniref:Subtilisin-like serine protease n=1 Tax=[Torrubiella] hemipterigena TaxID=1531966 RepID=A0A0A1T523_9HYPO|nr:hypothetical protein VHEMI01290 [[Torrubiella] hemipterigena]